MEVPTPAETRKLWCLYSLYPPSGSLTSKVSERRPFENGSFEPKVISKKVRPQSTSFHQYGLCENAGPMLRNVETEGHGKNTRNISALYSQKALNGITGKVKNASRSKNTALLVHVQHENRPSAESKTPRISPRLNTDTHR